MAKIPKTLVRGRTYKLPIEFGKLNPKNENEHSAEQIDFLRARFRRLGQQKPIVAQPDGLMEAGHGWWQAMKAEGATEAEFRITDLEGEKADEFRVSDNASARMSHFNPEALIATKERMGDAFDPEALGFGASSPLSFDFLAGSTPTHSNGNGDGNGTGPGQTRPLPTREEAYKTLADRFLVPPFSVLDARQGYWQERKRAWIALGIKSEVGRGANLLSFSDTLLEPDPAKRAEKGMAMGGKYKDPTPNMGGIPDNPEAAIPGYYRMIKSGMTKEEVVQWWVKKKGKGSQAIGNTDWIKDVKGEEFTGLAAAFDGTSIFDPVLCEIAYRWFSPMGGIVVDPFAGGSVRGVVASRLGRQYFGSELREEQVQANVAQLETIACEPAPDWVAGDSVDIQKAFKKIHKKKKADLVFSCPPYGDLEKYSEDERDISAMPHEKFLDAYFEIIKESCALLEDNRFAVFVVSEFRSPEGAYRNFVEDTVRAFRGAGLSYYNEAIFVQPVGSLPVRAGKQFSSGRKLGRTHQNVLVFVKGDWKKAVEACGEVEVSFPFDLQVAANAEEAPSSGEPAPAPVGEATQYGERLTAADLSGGV